VDRAVSRGECYCGRISRHGLLFLISRHLQDVTTAETTLWGSSIVVQTTLGRFKFYEHNDKSFVHFDRGTRSSNVDLVPNQKLEDVLKAASGQYLLNGSTDFMNFVWQRCSGDPEDLGTGCYFGMPDAVIYMNRNVLESWNRLKRFSNAMLDAMTSVLDELEEPSSFVEILKNLRFRNRLHSSANHDGRLDFPRLSNAVAPAERLVASVYLCEMFSDTKLEYMKVEDFHTFTQLNLAGLVVGHQHFRSPKAEGGKLFTTSRDRFMQLFRQYSVACNTSNTGRSVDTLREELRKLLISNTNNVALVVYQGFFAQLARWNSGRVLLRAREAPQEWIRFIAADEDYIYIG